MLIWMSQNAGHCTYLLVKSLGNRSKCSLKVEGGKKQTEIFGQPASCRSFQKSIKIFSNALNSLNKVLSFKSRAIMFCMYYQLYQLVRNCFF